MPPGRFITARTNIFYGWIIVGASFLMLFVLACNIYSFGIFFKSLQAEFGWSRTVTSSVMASYWLFHLVFAAPVGWLSDHYGPRRVLFVCNLLSACGLFLMSQVYSLWQGYLFFGVMIGCGMAGTFAILSATAARWFVRRRGLALGLVACGIGTGTIAAGPFTLGFINLFGWRGAYAAFGVLALFLLVLPCLLIYRDPQALGLVPYGQNAAAEPGRGPSPKNAQEKEKIHRIIHAEGLPVGQVVRTPHFWIMLLVFALFMMVMQMTMAHLYNHATDLRIPGSVAATVVSMLGASSLIGRLSIGALSDRSGPRLALMLCLAVAALSFGILTFARSLWMFVLFAAVYGIAYGGEVPLMPGFGNHLFGLKSLGFIVGACIGAGSLGGAVGPMLGGMIFDYLGSYAPAFAIAAGVNLLGIVLILMPCMKRQAFAA